MEEFFELNRLDVNHPQIEVVRSRDELWHVLDTGHMVHCKDAGPTFFTDLFGEEADVAMSCAPSPHGDVCLSVYRREGGEVIVNQRSRFPLEGFSWKLKAG